MTEPIDIQVGSNSFQLVPATDRNSLAVYGDQAHNIWDADTVIMTVETGQPEIARQCLRAFFEGRNDGRYAGEIRGRLEVQEGVLKALGLGGLFTKLRHLEQLVEEHYNDPANHVSVSR